ncbi:restriction endonuclease subunit S [Desulfobacterales bacterium HSG2]|nr:restriction endonuclease subunit S [Desulfobacterales bacterium HSG2]
MDKKELLIDKSDWKPTRLGDLANEVSKRVDTPAQSEFDKFVGLKHFVSGDLKIKKWDSTETLTSSTKAFEKGDILFARRNAYLRRASLVQFAGVCSGDAFVLKENHDKIVSNFLAFVVNSNSLWDFANSNAAGTMSKRVKWRDLAEYEFLLPPKDQQAQLAELLWATDAVVEKTRKVKNIVHCVLHATFKELCHLQMSKKYRIKDLLVGGPRNGFSPKRSSEIAAAKTVSIGAIKEGVFTPEGNIKYAKVDDDVLQKFDVRAGDVFIVRGNGNKNLCGRAGLSMRGYTNLFYPDLLIRLRFDLKQVLPDFVAFQWNSVKTHSDLMRRAKSTNGIWKINGDDIKLHKLEIPPISEQRKIMAEISKIDLLLQCSKVAETNSKQLLISLINEVF